MIELPVWTHPIVGQIAESYARQRLPHALMLVGREGDGLSLLGDFLRRGLLCKQGGIKPCGQCKSCLLVHAGAHPDSRVLEPEGKSLTIKVDQIRGIADFMHETPQQGGNKVIRLTHSEKMNNAAANAVLKMLEEPTPNTYLILESSSLSRMLPTVRSRCRLYKLEQPGHDQAHQWLTDNGIEQPEQRLAMADGAPLAASRISNEAIDQWHRQVSCFLQERNFTALAAFIQQQDPLTLLNQTLLWVDTAIRRLNRQTAPVPERDEDLVQALQGLPTVSLFRFRDYIVQLKQGLQQQANLNQQMWSEQLSARWLEMTGHA
ncbi:DNA polymerase III subunit delta' [Saccharospirillum impatiens]|uniref:DNA polymerase III subunit delta' n=1 Tax=Saccharospirillum impatiens TaxID=169438 RepID=UPI0004100E6B|nr:DNA polymerase III subunit delta' [Saccharospirillum impatiens]